MIVRRRAKIRPSAPFKRGAITPEAIIRTCRPRPRAPTLREAPLGHWARCSCELSSHLGEESAEGYKAPSISLTRAVQAKIRNGSDPPATARDCSTAIAIRGDSHIHSGACDSRAKHSDSVAGEKTYHRWALAPCPSEPNRNEH